MKDKAKKEEEEKKKALEAQMQSVTMSKVSDVEVKLSAVEKENGLQILSMVENPAIDINYI